MTTESAIVRKNTRPNGIHCHCYVCGKNNKNGLGLEFVLLSDGSVQSYFECSPAFSGYQGLLHGGITSALLDGAMTHCLFAHGHVAVTAELLVRFRHPVQIGQPAIIRAWITRSEKGFFELKSELHQQGGLKARAIGKFLEKPSWKEKSEPHE